MSEQYLISNQTLTNIANAIREKEGSTDQIMAGDFAERILEIETGGPQYPDFTDSTLTLTGEDGLFYYNQGYGRVGYDDLFFEGVPEENSQTIIINKHTDISLPHELVSIEKALYVYGELSDDGYLAWYDIEDDDANVIDGDNWWVDAATHCHGVAIIDENLYLPFSSGGTGFGYGYYTYISDSSLNKGVEDLGMFSLRTLLERCQLDPNGSAYNSGSISVFIYVTVTSNAI